MAVDRSTALLCRRCLCAALLLSVDAVALFGRRPTTECVADRRRQADTTTDLVARKPKVTTATSRASYYGGVSLAGATACSLTHCVVIPLDVIKTRMQSDAAAAAAGSAGAAAAILRDAPGKGLLRLAAFFNGLPPTALGYFLQGGTKFGGYEVLKQQAFARLRSSGGEEAVRTWQLPVMLASAASAEMAATVLLAPLEVLKLRMQTDAAAAANGVVSTFRTIVSTEGVRSLYKGLTPIAMRQLPYTVTKLVTYEFFLRAATFASVRLEQAFDLQVIRTHGRGSPRSFGALPARQLLPALACPARLPSPLAQPACPARLPSLLAQPPNYPL